MEHKSPVKHSKVQTLNEYTPSRNFANGSLPMSVVLVDNGMYAAVRAANTFERLRRKLFDRMGQHFTLVPIAQLGNPAHFAQINGQPIKLREDGTFNYHFSLPDGQYCIPIEATSPDMVESRSAMLSFQRFRGYLGEVNPTPQEPRPEPMGRGD